MGDVINASEGIEGLVLRIKWELKPGLDESVQTELANLVNLLPDLEESERSNLVGLAEIAVSALLVEQPNLKLAREVCQRIEKRIKAQEPVNPMKALRTTIRAVMGSESPSIRVILGLGTLLYFGIPLLSLLLSKFAGQTEVEVFGINASRLALVALAGGLGSIVSIMVRIQDFASALDVDPAILFFTGFFKPVIGMSFALFVFAAVSSGLVPVTIDPGSEQYFFLTFSFLAGFSERFARDIAVTTEQSVLGL